MPTIDIDRDAAHEAAQHELSKPIYPKPSLTERLLHWLEEVLYKLADASASLPGGWLTITVLAMLLIVAIVVAIRVARRTMRTNRGGESALFGEHELSAAEHRATAEQFAAVDNWSAAIRHRLRAVARQLEESSVLERVPGRTATELARDAGRAIPPLGNELRRAAEAFNDVTYGERPGTESSYQMVAELDDHLRSRIPAVDVSGSAPTASGGWADVR
ncbi:DUF4129 domain-containing protein [Mycobacterium sp. 3519A]|uniref:DUF4129 domain-containing protein n=1 Tax=Mycobacterium sp. 3519A TaxID=2057184 RepID=UPI000C797369|nr:DUF4129 domain-containing protein [Mycobacterium sp. 3519A]